MKHLLAILAAILAMPAMAESPVQLTEKLDFEAQKYFLISPYQACAEKEGFYLEKYKRYTPVNSPSYAFKKDAEGNPALKITARSDAENTALRYRTMENGKCAEKQPDASTLIDDSHHQTVAKIYAYHIWPETFKEKDIRELQIPASSQYGQIKPFMKSGWDERKIKLSIQYPAGVKPTEDTLTLGGKQIHITFK